MNLFEIMHTVERLVKDVAEIKKGDKVLVVTDSGRLKLGEAFALAARGAGAETVMATMPITKNTAVAAGRCRRRHEGGRCHFGGNDPCHHAYQSQARSLGRRGPDSSDPRDNGRYAAKRRHYGRF